MTESSEVDHKAGERELAHSRRVVGTAKLVVPFSAATAATFVATALQTGDPTRWDKWSAWLLIPALVITVAVVLLPPFHHKGKLEPNALDSIKKWTWTAYWLMVIQVGFSATSALVAVVGLLHKDWI